MEGLMENPLIGEEGRGIGGMGNQIGGFGAGSFGEVDESDIIQRYLDHLDPTESSTKSKTKPKGTTDGTGGTGSGPSLIVIPRRWKRATPDQLKSWKMFLTVAIISILFVFALGFFISFLKTDFCRQLYGGALFSALPSYKYPPPSKKPVNKNTSETMEKNLTSPSEDTQKTQKKAFAKVEPSSSTKNVRTIVIQKRDS